MLLQKLTALLATLMTFVLTANASSISSKINPQARAILLDDGGRSSARFDEYDSLAGTSALRKERRVGIGAVLGGPAGLGGVQIELNLNSAHSFITGFGGGPRYQSFFMGWRRNFISDKIGPYIGASYARWASNGISENPIEKTTPGFLGNKYLSQKEKADGKFSKDFVIPNFGIQYNHLDGEYRGIFVNAEISVLMELSDLGPTPAGSIGFGYYF